jgi:hypothetical protein
LALQKSSETSANTTVGQKRSRDARDEHERAESGGGVEEDGVILVDEGDQESLAEGSAAPKRARLDDHVLPAAGEVEVE